jgi:hypothetical protein
VTGWRQGRWVAGAALPVALLLSGCTPSGQGAALDAADRFQAAVQANDANLACELLSEEAVGNLASASGKSCVAAFPNLNLPTGPVSSVEVWGDNSQVRLDSEVLFLAEFSTGWKVTAAGCEPRPDMPYDCDVEG